MAEVKTAGPDITWECRKESHMTKDKKTHNEIKLDEWKQGKGHAPEPETNDRPAVPKLKEILFGRKK